MPAKINMNSDSSVAVLVYNLQVASYHNYFVTGSTILVHNKYISVFDTSRKTAPFTIAHIEKAIQAGRLDEEVINS